MVLLRTQDTIRNLHSMIAARSHLSLCRQRQRLQRASSSRVSSCTIRQRTPHFNYRNSPPANHAPSFVSGASKLLVGLFCSEDSGFSPLPLTGCCPPPPILPPPPPATVLPTFPAPPPLPPKEGMPPPSFNDGSLDGTPAPAAVMSTVALTYTLRQAHKHCDVNVRHDACFLNDR